VKEEDQILNLLENNDSSSHYDRSRNEYLSYKQVSLLSMEKIWNSLIEIFSGKALNVNKNLEEVKKNQLIGILQNILFILHGNTLTLKGLIIKLAYIISTLNIMQDRLESLNEE